MAWFPVQGAATPWMAGNNNTASGYVLKFYADGTSTNISMATDNTGGTTLTDVVLDSNGYASNSSTIFIPHIDQAYKVSLYATQAAADADTPVVWSQDNMPIPVDGTLTGELASTSDVAKGDALVGVINTRTGGVATTQHAVNERTAHLFDWLTAAEQTDVTTNAALVDIATPYQAAIDSCEGDSVKLILPMGTIFVNTTAITMTDRISMVGASKEGTKILSSATSGIVLHLAEGAGGKDPEESYFADFSIETNGTPAVGFQLDPSYCELNRIRLFIKDGSSDFTTAAIQTKLTVNSNQTIFRNCEVRSQSNPGGTLGLHIPRGANILIEGGYYGDYDVPIRLGDGTNAVTNAEISGGTLIETFNPHNSTSAIGLDVLYAVALNVGAARFQTGAHADHRCIAIQRWRGGSISGCSFDGTSTATAAISFRETTENATGIVIEGIAAQSIGSASTNFIELTGTSNTISGATRANPVVLTVTAHTFANGDEITVESITGMTELNDRKFIVANQATNTVELTGEDGTSHTAWSSGGTAIKYHDPDVSFGTNNLSGTGNRSMTDPAFRDQDATPSVGLGNFFKTANTAATTIADLDGVARTENKTVTVQIGDANTTVDFTGSALKGNNGVSWTPVSGDSMICSHHDQVWYCNVGKQTTETAYTLNATVVIDRTLVASGVATTLNNNNVLAGLITDLKAAGIID